MPDPHILIDGVVFGESPRWHDGRLWFCDWAAGQVVAVDPDGSREVVLTVDFPAFPMSIDFAADGTLLVVGSAQSALLRVEPDGSLAREADLSPVARTPWNEIVLDARGKAYINCIGFDFPGGEFAPGLVALVTPDGAVRQVADGVAFPNGMAITADSETLIVAESYGERLTAFDIDAEGGLSGRRTWAQTPGHHPDGICVDAAGAVWYADVGTDRCVRVAEGGEVLDTIVLDRGCFACMLGGDDGQTLFIVAQQWGDAPDPSAPTGQVLTTRAPSPHAGRP
jgi:sugar lactone lactonase YvrE